jgi:cytochrome P450 family 6
MEGAKWKAMRSTLSPTFTTGRMKIMFPLVLECADVFDKYLNKLASRRIDSDIKVLILSTDNNYTLVMIILLSVV